MRNCLIVSSHDAEAASARRHTRGVRHSQAAIRSQTVIGHGRATRPSRDRGCLKSAGRDITHEEHLTVVPVTQWRPGAGNPFGQPADLHAGVARIPQARVRPGGRA
jgi:hypothetical protein